MLKTRVVTAFVLVLSFLAALFLLPAFAWDGLMVLLSLFAALEWGRFMGMRRLGSTAYAILTTAAVAILILLAPDQWPFVALAAFSAILLLFWIVIVPFWLRFNRPPTGVLSLGVVGWLAIVPLVYAMVYLRAASPLGLLLLMLVVWIADTGAYFSGKRFGKHKLAPAISPGKTVEGALGGLVLVAFYGLGLGLFLLPDILANAGFEVVSSSTAVVSVLVVAALAVLSIIGDLFESMLKRQRGLKDSGMLLPGHGGILDRVDGLTSTLPFALLATLWLSSTVGGV